MTAGLFAVSLVVILVLDEQSRADALELLETGERSMDMLADRRQRGRTEYGETCWLGAIRKRVAHGGGMAAGVLQSASGG